MFKGYREYRAFKKIRKQNAMGLSAKVEQSTDQYLTQQVSELTQQLEAIKQHLGIYLYKNPGRYEIRETGKVGGAIGEAMQSSAPINAKRGN